MTQLKSTSGLVESTVLSSAAEYRCVCVFVCVWVGIHKCNVIKQNKTTYEYRIGQTVCEDGGGCVLKKEQIKYNILNNNN